MLQRWKGVKGYKGYYTVSDRGDIKSIDRAIKQSNGKMRTKWEQSITWGTCQ